MNKIFLKLVMLPSGLWRSMGADTEQLAAILDIRLKLDDRKPIPFGRQRTQKKERNNSVWLNMFIAALTGLVYIFALATIKDRIFGLTISFSFFLFMLTFMLITDFSNVLFDTRDKYIIVPRPVSDITIVLSRLLHVFIYLFRIILPMSLPMWITLGILDGWKSALLFPLPLILLACIAIFLVNCTYLLLLKLAKPERFKDIINYFQIAFSIVLFASGYLMRGMLNTSGNIEDLVNLDISKHSWVMFTPSYWLASFWSLLGFPVNLAGTQWFFILAIALPLLCLWLLVKYLSPQFARAIGGIDTVAAAEYAPVAQAKTTGGKFYQKLANLMNKDDVAKAGFIITWLQTSRSRSFKMKVYPFFAYMPIYFVFLLTSEKHMSFKDAWDKATSPDNPSYLLLLYLSSFMLIRVLNYLTISDQYKSAWVYYATPVVTPGRVMSGAFKAMWIKFFLPLFILLAIFIVSVWGWPAITDVILALINVTLFAACMMRVSFRDLPFSMQEQMNQGGNRFLKSFIAMAIPSALGFGHYMAINILWLKLLFMVLSAILLWLVWDSYANTTWDAVRKTELE
ncbi:MAG: hypothetical protein P4L41_00805 [Flavipsychrobacter sp.]|nr:hypothetical protein [Flavipsychrobacter sp.]